jgi:hypothetical protein
MLTITIHPRFQEEKKYILHVLFEIYLGLPVRVETNPQATDYEIRLGNGKHLLVKDAFFQGIPEGEDYLQEKNIPLPGTEDWMPPIPASPEIRVLFGESRLGREGENIHCHADIIAAAFFMLSRWEEYAVKERDEHRRFPAMVSLVVREGFIRRPVVDEYVECLWAMLCELGISLPRKKQTFQEYPTHDVDHPRKWWGVTDLVRSVGGAILKRGNPKEAWRCIRNYRQGKDPYDTFGTLMKQAEGRGLQAHFFFMSGGTSVHDGTYDITHPRVRQLLQEIEDRGHRIGFHPSYHAYHDAAQFGREVELLRSLVKQPVTTGRQHYLRFETPATWRIWEQHGMEWDSSLYYAEAPGFRCGTCHAYPVFDFLEKKQLKLLERPLVAMDVSFIHYLGLSPNETQVEMDALKNTVHQYHGDWVWLWHNSTEVAPLGYLNE